LCKTCQEHSNLHGPTAVRQQPIKTTQVLEKMGMYPIGPLPKSKQGHVCALVMQDYFTKWPKVIPLQEATAKSVAGVLLSVILTWGPPAELLSNQGPEFVVELNHELCPGNGGSKGNTQQPTTPKLMDWLSSSTGCSSNDSQVHEWQAGQLGPLPASLPLHL